MSPTLPRSYSGVVRLKEKVSPDVYRLLLELPVAIEYISGQYASFLIGQHRRPFSFAAPPRENIVEFLIDVSPNGIASKYCCKLSRGDVVSFLAPYGRFFPDGDDRPLLLVATGTGVAPFRAQLYDSRFHHRLAHLFFGAVSQDHLFMESDFREYAGIREKFLFTPVCIEGRSSWDGEIGMIGQVVLKNIRDINTYAIYICGGPAMIRETTDLFMDHGALREHIHKEEFV